jgi:hypothetical protein
MIKLERLQTKDGVTQLWECEKFEANFKYLSFAAIYSKALWFFTACLLREEEKP